MSFVTLDAPNLPRREIPGHSGWTRTARAGDPRSYAHGAASFQVDPPRLAEAIERTMGGLTDARRAKVLGLKAARLLGFAVPESAV